MTIQIEYETEIALGVEYRELIERVVNAAADYEGCPYEAEVSVLLTDDAAIREMNRDFRQIDAPTDVLSFPAVAYEEPSGFGLLEEDDAGCFNPDTAARRYCYFRGESNRAGGGIRAFTGEGTGFSHRAQHVAFIRLRSYRGG